MRYEISSSPCTFLYQSLRDVENDEIKTQILERHLDSDLRTNPVLLTLALLTAPWRCMA